MNNERYQEIIDDAYKNYLKNFTPPECPPNLDVQPDYYKPMSKDMFIYGIKTNDEFSERWGLKIEERELSLEERNYSLGSGKAYLGIFGMDKKDDLEYKELFDKENRPTKLITITYNNQSIEVYE